VPTLLARFGDGPGPLYGDAAVRASRGTGTGRGAYLDLAAREGAEIALPTASCPTHGAMVTGSFEDGERQFLKRPVPVDPKTPMAVALDMHSNLYDEIVAHATVVTGHRT
jgi:microcystin degradation protein MlrC